MDRVAAMNYLGLLIIVGDQQWCSQRPLDDLEAEKNRPALD